MRKNIKMGRDVLRVLRFEGGGTDIGVEWVDGYTYIHAPRVRKKGGGIF
jgi:hypothetical protein